MIIGRDISPPILSPNLIVRRERNSINVVIDLFIVTFTTKNCKVILISISLARFKGPFSIRVIDPLRSKALRLQALNTLYEAIYA